MSGRNCWRHGAWLPRDDRISSSFRERQASAKRALLKNCSPWSNGRESPPQSLAVMQLKENLHTPQQPPGCAVMPCREAFYRSQTSGSPRWLDYFLTYSWTSQGYLLRDP